MDTIEWGGVQVTRIGLFENAPLTPAHFFPGTDPAQWQADRSWLAPEHWDPHADRVRIAVQAWLLRSAGRTVLVDTGLATDSARTGVPAGGPPLLDALAAAGVAAEDVDTVVCTHLHADHVGGNTVLAPCGERVPAFPRARYLFSRADLEFFDPRTLTEQPGRSAVVYAESVEPVLRAGQADVWEGGHVVDENLRLEPAPGHTPGHALLSLASGGERALFVGDVLHSPAQVRTPEVSSCFCHDPAAAARTRARVLHRAADEKALLVPAHFCGTGAVEVTRRGAHVFLGRWAAFG
ncbi:MBL fold metallo-hydrolase [Streptomyces sp. NRRL F-5123]|uniref:MBL fold metallo-hydrolase n=1 Tax=Streptomyces sp. NRRL F-5123 TaxID=1463856 RepID=UPI0004E1371C|nr:MBL fold metallo-hydrolase [Streptomyces sp. NRRL F-5123]